MGLRSYYFRTGQLPRHKFFRIEVAHFKTGFQQSHDTRVDSFTGDESLLHGTRQRRINRTALHIRTGTHTHGRCFGRCLHHMMVSLTIEVADGTAVAHHQAVVPPLSAEYLMQITGVATARGTVDALVGTHHFAHVALLHEALESRQVGFPKVALGQSLHVKHMPVPFRTAMHGIVFGTSQCLVVARTLGEWTHVSPERLPLQSVDHGQSHARSEIGVFTVGLLPAPPTRIAEDIDVGCPYRHPLIAFDVTRLAGQIVLGHSLIRGGTEHAVEQFVVPRGGHSRRLRENSGETVAGNAVQGLAPPFKLGYAQPRNGR